MKGDSAIIIEEKGGAIMERKKRKGGFLYLALFLAGFFLLGKSTFLGVSLIALSFILPPILEGTGKKMERASQKATTTTLPHPGSVKKKSSSALFYIVLIIFFIIFPPLALLMLFIKILAGGSEKKKKTTYETIKSTTYKDYKHIAKTEKIGIPNHSTKSDKTYIYSTSHTENEVKSRRRGIFSGTIHLHTTDIGDAIGLIRITSKLAGIKKITIQATLTGDITILGIPSKDKVFRAKTRSIKKAITLIRKLYAADMLKALSMDIEIEKVGSPHIDTLREIAEETYHAVWEMGGEKDVFAV